MHLYPALEALGGTPSLPIRKSLLPLPVVAPVLSVPVQKPPPTSVTTSPLLWLFAKVVVDVRVNGPPPVHVNATIRSAFAVPVPTSKVNPTPLAAEADIRAAVVKEVRRNRS
jgi:hypothetical protein